MALAVVGLVGYLLGCRRPTLEELYANEFEQLTPDEEFLLGGGGVTSANETKVPIPPSTNEFFDNSPRDIRYEPLERTRIGQSNEDMV